MEKVEASFPIFLAVTPEAAGTNAATTRIVAATRINKLGGLAFVVLPKI